MNSNVMEKRGLMDNFIIRRGISLQQNNLFYIESKKTEVFLDVSFFEKQIVNSVG